MAVDEGSTDLLDRLLDGLRTFTGAAWEQEDDITLVALRRSAGVSRDSWDKNRGEIPVTHEAVRAPSAEVQPLLAFTIQGAIGNEREAMTRVGDAVGPLGLEPSRLERLKTAVAETVMNAIEYGSQGNPEVPVDVWVDADEVAVRVRVTDRALSGPVPDVEPPDLDAKLEGRQRPRGWGLFLIRHMVDAMDVSTDDGLQTVTLTLARDGR
jgi:anti-sigma regulatory factor (Ser/Thr protein kinase)